MILSNYKSGKLPFLVNVKILVEGFDAPITKGVCFMSLPSSSTTLIQIIGRALRLHPEKKIANVILPFSKLEDEKAICNFMKVMAKNDSRIYKSYKNKKLGGYIDIFNIVEEKEVNEEEKEIKETEVNEEIDLMKDINIKYELIFDSMGTFKNNFDIWNNNFDKFKKFIDNKKKLPSTFDKNKETKVLGSWFQTQQINYKTKSNIMNSEEIYNKWTEFINDSQYREYFLDNDIIWISILNKVKKFIDDNKKKPSKYDTDKESKTLGYWIIRQQYNYKTKLKIMASEKIYNIWTEFINDYKYKKYFVDNDIIWINTLYKAQKFIDDNKKKPSTNDKDKEIKTLGFWIKYQENNYKTKSNIMKSEEIYNKWTEFINNYKEYFLDNDIIWINTLDKTKKFMDDHKKIPSSYDKDKEIKILGSWFQNQQHNYKTKSKIMKSEKIYNKWTEFINDSKYKDHFLDNDIVWINTLDKAKKFINDNKKKPSTIDKNKEIKTLSLWLQTQKNNYKSKSYIMKSQEIYNKWTEFINDSKYKEYLKF